MQIPIDEKLAAIGRQLTPGNVSEQFRLYRNGQDSITYLFKGSPDFKDADDRIELICFSKGGFDPRYHREQDKFLWFLDFSSSPLIHIGKVQKDENHKEFATIQSFDAIPHNLYEINKGIAYGSSPKKDGLIYVLVGDHIGRYHRERSVSYSEDIIFVHECIYV